MRVAGKYCILPRAPLGPGRLVGPPDTLTAWILWTQPERLQEWPSLLALLSLGLGAMSFLLSIRFLYQFQSVLSNSWIINNLYPLIMPVKKIWALHQVIPEYPWVGPTNTNINHIKMWHGQHWPGRGRAGHKGLQIKAQRMVDCVSGRCACKRKQDNWPCQLSFICIKIISLDSLCKLYTKHAFEIQSYKENKRYLSHTTVKA